MDLNRITDIQGMNFLFKVDNLFLGGQPAPESLKELKNLNIKKVVNLRSTGEGDFSFEEEFFSKENIEYFHFPILGEQGLDRSAIEKLNSLITDDNILIHCASANRVGGWLITYLVEEKKMEFDKACEIAMQSGLTNPGLISAASMAIESK